MDFIEEFKYLNLELMKKKNANELPEDERNFIILNLLDKNNNPCRFFVFDKEVMKKILTSNFVGLQLLNVSFKLLYTNNTWNVRLVDISE